MSTLTLKKSPLFRFTAFTVLVAFVGFLPVQPSYAQVTIMMPPPGQIVHITNHFEPAQMIGLKINLKDPFSFDFIMDQGENQMSDEDQREEFNKIIKYFLVSLAMPNKDMWVNLSPYESNHIIPEVFGQTEMGRDLLAQDYILKQFTASLMYPEDGLGKSFWSRVYSEAQARFGTTDINVNTFNKVWIVADKADVYQKDNTAFLVKSHLRVMLEQDFMAIEKNKEQFGNVQALEEQSMDAKTQMASNIVREIIIPAIEKEVNEGKGFAAVRQAYNAEIMATWFKKTLRESLLGQVFANKSKIAGQRVSDPQAEEKIYQEYLKAYKKGVFNYIKEDATPDGQIIPRKYFSGGFVQVEQRNIENITPATIARNPAEAAMVSDFAQSSKPLLSRWADATVRLVNTARGQAPVVPIDRSRVRILGIPDERILAAEGPSREELDHVASAEVAAETAQGISKPQAQALAQTEVQHQISDILQERSAIARQVVDNLPRSAAFSAKNEQAVAVLNQWTKDESFSMEPHLPLFHELKAAAAQERAVATAATEIQARTNELEHQTSELSQLNDELARTQHNLEVFTASPVQDENTRFLIENYSAKINGANAANGIGATPGLQKRINDLTAGMQQLQSEITTLQGLAPQAPVPQALLASEEEVAAEPAAIESTTTPAPTIANVQEIQTNLNNALAKVAELVNLVPAPPVEHVKVPEGFSTVAALPQAEQNPANTELVNQIRVAYPTEREAVTQKINNLEANRGTYIAAQSALANTRTRLQEDEYASPRDVHGVAGLTDKNGEAIPLIEGQSLPIKYATPEVKTLVLNALKSRFDENSRTIRQINTQLGIQSLENLNTALDELKARKQTLDAVETQVNQLILDTHINAITNGVSTINNVRQALENDLKYRNSQDRDHFTAQAINTALGRPQDNLQSQAHALYEQRAGHDQDTHFYLNVFDRSTGINDLRAHVDQFRAYDSHQIHTLQQQLTSARNVGGINLSDEHQTLNIKVDGAGMPLPAQFQDKSLLNLNGLTSVIRQITPITPENVPALYELLK